VTFLVPSGWRSSLIPRFKRNLVSGKPAPKTVVKRLNKAKDRVLRNVASFVGEGKLPSEEILCDLIICHENLRRAA
jgi:hypothetical protein